MVDALWPHLVDQVHVKDGRDGAMGDCRARRGRIGLRRTARRAAPARGFAGSAISENDYHGEAQALAARDIAIVARPSAA